MVDIIGIVEHQRINRIDDTIVVFTKTIVKCVAYARLQEGGFINKASIGQSFSVILMGVPRMA